MCLSQSHLTFGKLNLGKDLILDTVISGDGLQSSYDVLKRCSENSKLGSFSYAPVSFCRHQKIKHIDKLLLTFKCIVLDCLQDVMPKRGFLIYGENFTKKSVLLPPHIKTVEKMMADLNAQMCTAEEVPIFLNHHCNICEFSNFCESKALETDHLSLLRGISEKEINRHNKKGIFTVNQLSYTFRPRKTPKRAKKPAKPHYFALQALSLRENKIHIHGKPELPVSETNVYFDIEGVPERDFYYLIGMIIVDNGTTTYQNYWANQKADEEKIFCRFAESLQQLPNYSLFHYGSYDATALKHMKKRLTTQHQKTFESILGKTVNVLSVIYSHIYFPVYSNNLKDIGALLGCKWSDTNVSGIRSIIWREKWEEKNELTLKKRLIRYNKEDCLALKTICDFITCATSEESKINGAEQYSNIVNTNSLLQPSENGYTFGKQEFVFSDLEYINSCAYFDYQREKVFVRTSKYFKKINKRKNKKSVSKPNKCVEIYCKKCPKCGSSLIKQQKGFSKPVIDVKFFKCGVKKWGTQYISWQYKCLQCKELFVSENLPDHRTKYGHGLIAWCVYHNVDNGQNMQQVRRGLLDLFDLHISQSQAYRFKSSIAEFYKPTYEAILNSIIDGPVMHIDETSVKLIEQKGYVWVITSIDKVYYFYKESREGSFLKDMLKGFSGVLISDFYTAYDSFDCSQQKCLIHLIRDMNEDLKKNPFDDEFKNLIQQFSSLLRMVINTVDKHGLKRWYLHKHKKTAEKFLQYVYSKKFSFEVAQKYQKRFQKNRDKLFTFLDYDGVPWNNNNAEHAIKSFAKYRTYANGRLTERSLSEYLIMLSVFQTCEYNNTNVLKFLLSKSKDIPTTLA